MKSKGTAYLLWFFLGIFGAHKFYLGKIGTGILYLFTFGLLGIGWFIDLFTLSQQVDIYNGLNLHFKGRGGNTNTNQNNIVVNVPGHQPNSPNTHEQLHKLSELKEKGVLTEDEFNDQKAKLLS